MQKRPYSDGTILPYILCTWLVWGAHVPISAKAQSIPIHIDDYTQTLPRHDLRGVVLNKNKQPIAGAELWLYYAWGRNGVRDRLVGRGTTDGQGGFVFKQSLAWEPAVGEADREPPHYVVIARHADHGIYFTKVFKGDTLNGVTLVMRRSLLGETGNKARTHKIMVQDPKGNPIAGARVFLFGARLVKSDLLETEDQYHRMRIRQDIGVAGAVSNVHGMAEVAVAPSAEYCILKEGYQRTWVRGSKAVLFKGASVSGKVSYPDGSPAVRALVQYAYAGYRNKWVFTDFVLTDAQGHYVFDHVPAAGFYYSWMNPEGEKDARGMAGVAAQDLRVGSRFLCQRKCFIIKPGDRLEQDLCFEAGVILAGKVIDVGTSKAVPQMEMELTTETSPHDLASQHVIADANGLFRVTVPFGSDVMYHCYRSRSKDTYLMERELGRPNVYIEDLLFGVTEDHLDVRFRVKLIPLQPLTGQVLDTDGATVANAVVHVHGDLPSARTDDAGVFTLKAAFADRAFDIFAESEDETQAGFVHLEAGTNRAKITLTPTQRFTGQVTSTEGQPVGNLAFHLELRLNKDGISWVRRDLATDQEGAFKVMHLCPEATYHAYWSAAYTNQNRDYAYGDAPIDLNKADNTICFTAQKYSERLTN